MGNIFRRALGGTQRLDLDRLHADGEQILKPLKLTDGERADLVAFLQTLTDPHALAWRITQRHEACGVAR